jgi:ankyrin repeat protein
MEMLAARASLREDGNEDEDAIVLDDKLSKETKRDMLQKSLNMAASNGDVEKVARLVNGKAKEYVDVNMVDEEGTAPLIYASCFGHQEVVSALLDAGAYVDKQDRNQWSSLMWAMTNRHKAIAKILLDHGASPDVKSSSGRTAYDFVAPNSELSDFLHESGYHILGVGRPGMTSMTRDSHRIDLRKRWRRTR